MPGLRRLAIASIAAGALAVGCVAPAHAEDMPSETAADTAERTAEMTESAVDPAHGAVDTVESAAASDAPITVPERPNEIAVDLLGRGYEQIVRLAGSKVEIREPKTRGGGEIRSIDVGATERWPRTNRGVHSFGNSGRMLEETIGHDPSRIAVSRDAIYVSTLRTKSDGTGATSMIRSYALDGRILNERHFSTNVAITALDALEHQGTTYLAIGLNQQGVRIVDAKEMAMPDVRVVHGDWAHDHAAGGEPVTVAKLAAQADGRLMLFAGKYHRVGAAVVATDLEIGKPKRDTAAGRVAWTNNTRPKGAPSQWPNAFELGKLSPNHAQTLAISWPGLGRVSFLDASNGADWTWVDGSPARVVRMFDDPIGRGFVGIARERGATVSVAHDGGLHPVRELETATELPFAIPAYTKWSLTIENRTDAAITLTPRLNPDPERRCWLDGPVPGAGGPLSKAPITIAPNAPAPTFTNGLSALAIDGCRQNGVAQFNLNIALDPSTGLHTQFVMFTADTDHARLTHRVTAGPYDVALAAEGAGRTRLVITKR